MRYNRAIALVSRRLQSTSSLTPKSLGLLENPGLLSSTQAFINGEYVDSVSREDMNDEATFDVVNPSNLEVIAKVSNMGVSDYNRAIDVAHIAFDSLRYTVSGRERSQWLYNMYELIRENHLDLAKIITLENGKTLKDSLSEIEYSASYFKWFAEEAPRIYGTIIPSSSSPNREIHARRQPLGVVGILTPWNFPSAMIARKLAAAIATGNSTVIKPAKETPLSALVFGSLSEKAGIPRGLVNILPTTYRETVGKLMVSNPQVKKISFTGSTKIGKKLLQQGYGADGNPNFLKYSMELGGNAPFIIDETADLSKALSGLVSNKFRGSGQTCICANRVYVHDSVFDKFTEMLKQHIESEFKLGDGFDSLVTQGPLIHQGAIDRIVSLVQDAKVKGAKIITGGTRASSIGPLFYHPTVLAECDNTMKIYHEEIFGPVCSLIRFSGTIDSVIAECNQSQYGLASYLYSQDITTIQKVSQTLDTGMLGVNTASISDCAMPFGGVKHSGFGREGSLHGIEDYTELKSVVYEH